MRRLLIRLVALETALVGWLSYWLFLLYANNPLIGQGLSAQLGRFPQLSFTTVDISVLAIIAGLSIFLAFKFQRGLRPGIRLERALQMLENLMKRNLVLEAQVAEMKMEKARVGISPPVSAPTTEPSAGSWERAFRTPIEAGPSVLSPTRVSPIGSEDSSFHPESFVTRGHRFESKTVSQSGSAVQPKPVPSMERGPDYQSSSRDTASDRPPDKPMGKLTTATGGLEAGSWEDSPRRISETSGILTPTTTPRSPAAVIPVSSKQPYIPIPVPKSAPPSVIAGPGLSHASPLRPGVKPVTLGQAASKSSGTPPGKSFLGPPEKQSSSSPVAAPGSKAPVPFASPVIAPTAEPKTAVEIKLATMPASKPEGKAGPSPPLGGPTGEPKAADPASKGLEKTENVSDAKAQEKTLKKSPRDEDEEKD